MKATVRWDGFQVARDRWRKELHVVDGLLVVARDQAKRITLVTRDPAYPTEIAFAQLGIKRSKDWVDVRELK
jgi:hypothetical protein